MDPIDPDPLVGGELLIAGEPLHQEVGPSAFEGRGVPQHSGLVKIVGRDARREGEHQGKKASGGGEHGYSSQRVPPPAPPMANRTAILGNAVRSSAQAVLVKGPGLLSKGLSLRSGAGGGSACRVACPDPARARV